MKKKQMKKTFMARIASVAIVALVAITALGMAGCKQPTDSSPPMIYSGPTDSRPTPVAGDFTITGPVAGNSPWTVAPDGNPKAVTIAPKPGKSDGGRTIYYTGTNPVVAKSTNAPSVVGAYSVTFDVAVTDDWKAATLTAGTLVIGTGGSLVIDDPHVFIDFESNWDATGYGARTVTDKGYTWSVTGVVTTTDVNDHAASGKSIRLRSNTNDTVPNSIEMSNFIHGIKAIHFSYGSYSSHNDGEIVLYTQVNGGSWLEAGRVTAPAWDGNMLSAEFDDLDLTNARFKIEKELSSTNYTSVNIDNIYIIANAQSDFDVVPVDPVPGDFIVTLLEQTVGDTKAVKIEPRQGKSQGDITIHYTPVGGGAVITSPSFPSTAESYTVTFDITVAPGFNQKNGLTVADPLVISEPSADPHFTVDFEDAAWRTGSAGGYAQRTINWNDYEWSVTGVTNPDANDRREGDYTIRLRGNAGDNCYVELVDYVTSGIKTISFKYASYSSHSNGKIILYYEEESGGGWVEAGTVTALSWTAAGSVMSQSETFAINKTGSVRFKIVREGGLANSTSVNIDNIVVTTY